MDDLTERVLGAVFSVSNSVGAGFPEKIYERALMLELGALGIRAEAHVPHSVFHRGQRVGDYFSDIVVEGVLLINLGRARVSWKRVVWRGMVLREE